MTERVYTVAEIDELRDAVWKRVVYGTTRPVSGTCSPVFGPGEVDRRVEERIRTYILAGITAEDLISEDSKPKKFSDAAAADPSDNYCGGY